MSPTGIVALEKAQFGIETTPGTLVAADTVLVCEGGGQYQPMIDRQWIQDNHGLLAPVAYLDVMKGAQFSFRHALDFEQILLPLLTGIQSGTPAGSDPYTWTFLPDPATVEDLKAATLEYSIFDGTTRHLQREAGFGTCSRFAITGGFNQPAMIEYDMFTRAPQTSTFTASQAALTRTLVPSNLFGLFIDTSWANLGTTQKEVILRSFRYEVNTGAAPNYTLDQRTDLDFTGLRRGMILGTVELVLEYGAAGDAEYDAWEAGTNRFISLEVAVGSKTLVLQAHIELTENPTFGEADGLRTVTLRGQMCYDATSTNFMNVEVVNALAAF